VPKQFTFGSLFAGIGGFDLGFERAGMTCKWQVEIDDHANRVLEKHWPDVRRHGDIKTFPPGDPDDWRVDCICGGFPCQDISYAGAGAGLAGERSGLFFDAMRVVRELEPRVVVLENVAALLTRGLDDVLGTLASLGFDAEWHCVPAAAVGAPHIRDRVFIVAYAQSQPGRNITSDFRNGQERHSRDESRSDCEDAGTLADAGRTLLEVRTERERDGRSGATQQHPSYDADSGRHGTQEETIRAGRGASELPGWWAVEPDVGRVANGVPARVDRLRGLGNAVVPQVAEWIGRRVMELLA